MPAVGPGTTGSAREQRLLKWSIVAAAAIGVLGIGWGWFAGSQAIMFDGRSADPAVGCLAERRLEHGRELATLRRPV